MLKNLEVVNRPKIFQIISGYITLPFNQWTLCFLSVDFPLKIIILVFTLCSIVYLQLIENLYSISHLYLQMCRNIYVII